MSEATAESPRVTGALASLDHIALIADKIERLTEASWHAEEQCAYAVGQAWAANEITGREVTEIYRRMRAFGRTGFAQRWDDNVPPDIAHMCLRRLGDGYRDQRQWSGTMPLDQKTSPWRGIPVVYVFYDVHSEPCYVGSTHYFANRIKGHVRDGKQFASWTAHACESRAAAYAMEDRLLKQYKPYLNRKAGR